MLRAGARSSLEQGGRGDRPLLPEGCLSWTPSAGQGLGSGLEGLLSPHYSPFLVPSVSLGCTGAPRL